MADKRGSPLLLAADTRDGHLESSAGLALQAFVAMRLGRCLAALRDRAVTASMAAATPPGLEDLLPSAASSSSSSSIPPSSPSPSPPPSPTSTSSSAPSTPSTSSSSTNSPDDSAKAAERSEATRFDWAAAAATDTTKGGASSSVGAVVATAAVTVPVTVLLCAGLCWMGAWCWIRYRLPLLFRGVARDSAATTETAAASGVAPNDSVRSENVELKDRGVGCVQNEVWV